VIAAGITASTIGRLYLSYGVLSGLGIGIGYNATLSLMNEWFPDKKGTSLGILMMSFGASALVCGNIAAGLMSSPLGWRAVYRLLGILTGSALLAEALLLRHPAAEDRIPELRPSSEPEKGILKQEPMKEYTPKKMLCQPVWLRFFLFLMLANAVGNSTISMARDVAVSVGAQTGLAALLAGILSLCNGVGRLFSGMLFDRFGQRFTMLLDGIITMAAPAVMLAAVLLHSVPVCAAGLCLSGFSYSFQPPVTTSVVSSFFGSKYFSINYSITNLVLIPASLSATISGVLYTSAGSFLAPFTLLLILSAFSFALNLTIRHT